MAEGDSGVTDSRFPLTFDGPKEGVKYPLKVQYVDGKSAFFDTIRCLGNPSSLET